MSRRAQHLGLAIAGGAAALSPAVLIGALPVIGIGRWPEAEPVIVLFDLFAATAAAGLALACVAGSRIARRAVLHPLVLLFAALALWGAVASATHDLPRLTWFGSPQLGDGAVSYFALAVLLAGGLVARLSRRLRCLVAVTALVATLAAVALFTFPFQALGETWRLYAFGDHYAFHGVLLIPILIGFLGVSRLAPMAAMAIVGLVVVLASGNRTAMLVAPVAVAGWFAVSLLAPRIRPVWLALAVASVGVALPILLVVTPRLPGSIGIRAAAISTALDVFDTTPSNFVTGVGWGRYSDLLIAGTTADEVASGVVLGDDRRVFFHSHALQWESLFALGVPGVALALALFVCLPLFARPRLRPLAAATATATVALGTFWFQLASSLPLMALAWAALGARMKPRPALPRAVVAVVVAAVALALAASAVATLRTALRATFFAPAVVARSLGEDLASCPDLLADATGSGIHLAVLYNAHANLLAEQAASRHDILPADVAGLAWYYCAADRAIDRGAVLELRNVDLLARADFAFVKLPDALRAVVAPRLASWGARLDAFLDRAPGRTDQAVPYLTWRLGRGETAPVVALTRRILRVSPLDPVALWFSGVVMLGDQETAADGRRRMRRALELGLERVMPVDPKLKTFLSNGNAQ